MKYKMLKSPYISTSHQLLSQSLPLPTQTAHSYRWVEDLETEGNQLAGMHIQSGQQGKAEGAVSRPTCKGFVTDM